MDRCRSCHSDAVPDEQQTESVPVLCRACRHNFGPANGVQSPDGACPNCGGTSRTVEVTLGVGVAAGVTIDATATFNESWKGQWKRAERSLARLRGIVPLTSHYAFHVTDDDLVHCFTDIWHVKDWLRNDADVPIDVRDQVEAYVQSRPMLQLAGDLANGMKHLKLTKRAHTGDFGTRRLDVHVTGDPTVGLRSTIRVTSNGFTHDATVVALRAMDNWREFLVNHDLL